MKRYLAPCGHSLESIAFHIELLVPARLELSKRSLCSCAVASTLPTWRALRENPGQLRARFKTKTLDLQLVKVTCQRANHLHTGAWFRSSLTVWAILANARPQRGKGSAEECKDRPGLFKMLLLASSRKVIGNFSFRHWLLCMKLNCRRESAEIF